MRNRKLFLILTFFLTFTVFHQETVSSQSILKKKKKEKNEQSSTADAKDKNSKKSKGKHGDKGTVVDVDSNVYNTINIDGQWWMVENLKTEHYQNGDEIDNVINPEKWKDLKTGAWASFDNKAENETISGKLYNGYAIIDPRGICPEGWRVPTSDDWEVLFGLLGMSGSGPDGPGSKLKAVSAVWDDMARNTVGFSALPGGHRRAGGSFEYGDSRAFFWSVLKTTKDRGNAIELVKSSSVVNEARASWEEGNSCRCIKE